MSLMDIIECSIMGSDDYSPEKVTSAKRGMYDPTDQDVHKLTSRLTNYRITSTSGSPHPHRAVDPDELEAVYEFIRCSEKPVTMAEIRLAMGPHIGKVTCFCAVGKLMRQDRVTRTQRQKHLAEYSAC